MYYLCLPMFVQKSLPENLHTFSSKNQSLVLVFSPFLDSALQAFLLTRNRVMGEENFQYRDFSGAVQVFLGEHSDC